MGQARNPEALTRLERFRFIAQVTHEGELSAPFALGGVRVEDVMGEPAAENPDRKGGAPRRRAQTIRG